MKTYIYDGPRTGLTLGHGKKAREVVLVPGGEVRLPDCDVVRTLAAMGRLSLQAETGNRKKEEVEDGS